VTLDFIENQGVGGTGTFEAIKDYPANISIFIHMTTAKRILQYLIFTVHFSLFHGNGNATATTTAMQMTIFIIYKLRLNS